MTDFDISIEGVSDELLAAYTESGMERGKGDQKGITWAFGGNEKAFAIARYDGRIAGVSAYIRSRMKFGPTVGFGYQAVDSFVMPDMRGQGVFAKLARAYDEHCERHGAHLVWGFPNTNAAPAWFGKLGWRRHGQAPFLIKPLRSGLFLRKLGIDLDVPLGRAKDQGIPETETIGDWGNVLWEQASARIECGTIRDQSFLQHRLIEAPQASSYRVVADTSSSPALVASRVAEKHGGKIAYLMEAMGGPSLKELLMSEIGRLRSNRAEAILAWSFPWSENYKTLRKAGFVPLPERLRPIEIWFGSRSKRGDAVCADQFGTWYLSYLDSDTV